MSKKKTRTEKNQRKSQYEIDQRAERNFDKKIAEKMFTFGFDSLFR